jgi:transposase InsO family protein
VALTAADVLTMSSVKARVRAMGIRDRPTSLRSPWQNGYVERLIGSVRRECTDHLIVFNGLHHRYARI